MNAYQEDSGLMPAIEPLPRQCGTGPVGSGLVSGGAAFLGASLGPVAPLISGGAATFQAFGQRVMKLLLHETRDRTLGPEWVIGPKRKVSDLGQETGLGDVVLPLVLDLVRTGICVEPKTNGFSAGTPGAYGTSYEAGPLALQLLSRLTDQVGEDGPRMADSK